MKRKRVWGLVIGTVLLGCAMGSVGPIVARAQDGDGGGMPVGSQMVRGTVTAAAGDVLTVRTETGETYKISVTTNTRVMKAREPVKVADIKSGDGIGAMGVVDVPTKTLHAVFVTVIDAEQVRKAKEDLGKTYIAGQVTAMDDLKLTIKRLDGVSQTIAVDEGTSFRRGGRGRSGGGESGAATAAGTGGESITLADIKVGDSVMGRGAIKGGVFTPTELRVMDHARRRGAGTGAEATAAPGVPQ